MNQHALGVLEFKPALELVAGYAGSSLGAERVRELRPESDRAWIEREHARVSAMRSLSEGDTAWSPQQLFDIRSSVSRMRVEGASLSAAELLAIRNFLRSSRLSAESFKNDKLPAVSIAMLRAEIDAHIVARTEEKSLETAIDDDGNVRDEASPALRRIRRDLRGAQGEIVKMLERVVTRLESRFQVPDMSVSVRNGRFVIPIRREGRAVVGGIVHDTSSTGGTLFVEPPAAVEAGNRLRELEAEEVARDRSHPRRAHRLAATDSSRDGGRARGDDHARLLCMRAPVSRSSIDAEPSNSTIHQKASPFSAGVILCSSHRGSRLFHST